MMKCQYKYIIENFEEGDTIYIAEEEYEEFIKILDNPGIPNKKLKEAGKKYKEIFGKKE